MDEVARLLQSRQVVLIASAVAVVAALLWDCEKTKVVFKNKGLKKILLDVEARIDTGMYPILFVGPGADPRHAEYDWVFDQRKDNDGNWKSGQDEHAEGMPEEDDEMLTCLKRRIGFVNGLL